MGNSQSDGIAQMVRSKNEHTHKEIQNAFALAQKIGLTEEKAFEIASLSVTDLIEKLNSKTLKSLDIVLAVIIRSSKIGKDLNCFTETNFGFAIEQAKKCDQQRETKKMNNWTFGQGQFKPNQNYFSPIFGVPISIKDTYDMEGFLTTVGLQSRINKKFPQSVLIKAIKKAGGIPFIRTNVPQLGMSCQCQNKIWGRTLNPWNRDRTVGGSSGGQAGLISSRCSFLGIGSDLAGSVRIPSEFCGLFGLKPYSKRISANYHTKFSNAFSGIANVIPLCIGPLARSTSDLAYFMKVVTEKDFFSNEQDPFTKIVSFDEKTYEEYNKNNKKLRIGIINQIASIQPTKTSIRALKETVGIFTKLGHQCFQIDFPNEREIISQFYRQNLGSQAAIYRQILQGQAPIKQYRSLFQVAEMSAPVRGIAKCGSKMMMPRVSSYVMQNIGQMSAYQYQDHVGRVLSYKEDWIKYWRNQKLDFVICPGFGSQAILHQKSQNISLAAAYTFVWNLLDVTVGSVPVTQVRQDEQQYETTHQDMISTVLRANAQNSVGLPAGIQLIGLPYQQQKVLGMMSVLQRNIQFYKHHPLPVLK